MIPEHPRPPGSRFVSCIRRIWLPVVLAWFLSTSFYLVYLAALNVINLPLVRVMGYLAFLIPRVLPELLLRFAVVVPAACAVMGILWCLRGIRPALDKPWRAGLIGASLGFLYAFSHQTGLRYDWPVGYWLSREMLALIISGSFFNTVLPAGLCGFLLSASIRQAVAKERWLEGH